jgi:O-antigen/teichoic acid export membrane protein
MLGPNRQPDNLNPAAVPEVGVPDPGGASRSLQLRRILVNVGGVVGVNLLSLITGPILARALGPAARGVLTAALLWPTLIAALLNLGITDAVTYFTSRGEVSPVAVLRTSERLAWLQGLGIAVVGIPIVFLTMHHFGTSAVVSSLIFLAAMPAQVFALYMMSYLNGVHRYAWFNIIQVQIFAVTAVAYVVLWICGALTVRTAAISSAGAVVVTLLVSIAVTHRGIGQSAAEQVPRLGRRLLGYGLRSYTSNLPHMLNDRVDQLVISLALPAHELGLYVIAATIATAPAFVGVAVANSVLPTVASQESTAEQVRAARRAIILTFGFTLISGILLAVAMRPFVRIVFGRPFLGGVGPARVLCLAAVMLSLTRVFHGLLKGLGRPLDAAISEAGALIVTAAGLSVLIPLMGIMGAALTSLAAYTTSTLIAVRLAAVALGIRPIDLALSRPPRGR